MIRRVRRHTKRCAWCTEQPERKDNTRKDDSSVYALNVSITWHTEERRLSQPSDMEPDFTKVKINLN